MIQVVYFGGYGSSQKQVDEWINSAKQQRSDINFIGYPYPSKGASEEDDLRDGALTISKIINEINSSNDYFIIVGHSSGCAASNEVARRTTNKNIELVVLDGFVPTKHLQQTIKTTCWSAYNPELKIGSRNYSALKQYAINFKVHLVNTPKTAWALHFSLVNAHVNPNLSQLTFISQGYQNQQTPLFFLNS